jgi:hypothetical protein
MLIKLMNKQKFINHSELCYNIYRNMLWRIPLETTYSHNRTKVTKLEQHFISIAYN